jgi:hypothetical protein
MIMTTGLEYVLGKLREIRDLAMDAPRVPQTLTAEALSSIANMTDRLLTAIEGPPPTLRVQLAEHALHRDTPADTAAEIFGFIRDLEDGDVERLVCERLNARRTPDPAVEEAAKRIVEGVRNARRAASHADRATREEAVAALIKVRDILSVTVASLAVAPEAVRARLVELTTPRGEHPDYSPYPGDLDDVAGEIVAFVDELDFTDAARGLRAKVGERLVALERRRVAEERQTRISVALRAVTVNHLRPALAEFGITLPENYALEWRETGDVVPGE